jgi:predicted DCC family thiol-disulfide oxidoreductase YuxK
VTFFQASTLTVPEAAPDLDDPSPPPISGCMMDGNDSIAPEEARPVVYYDGACPVCAREIAFYRRQKGAEAIDWVDAARCDSAALGAGLDRSQALARLHVRSAQGELVGGAAAFGLIWRGLPRFAWLGRLLGFPPVAWLAEDGYRLFLKLRRAWRR